MGMTCFIMKKCQNGNLTINYYFFDHNRIKCKEYILKKAIFIFTLEVSYLVTSSFFVLNICLNLKDLCEVIVWILEICQKSFCIQNFYFESPKNKCLVKDPLLHMYDEDDPFMVPKNLKTDLGEGGNWYELNVSSKIVLSLSCIKIQINK